MVLGNLELRITRVPFSGEAGPDKPRGRPGAAFRAYVGLTHGAEVGSDCRQSTPTADLSFYYFSTPPHSACRFTCVCRVVPVRSLWDLPWNVVPRGGHACEAPRVVLRGFVDLPLFAQGQHYVFYLSYTTGGGGSVSLITRRLSRTFSGEAAAAASMRCDFPSILAQTSLAGASHTFKPASTTLKLISWRTRTVQTQVQTCT